MGYFTPCKSHLELVNLLSNWGESSLLCGSIHFGRHPMGAMKNMGGDGILLVGLDGLLVADARFHGF